LTDTPPPTRVSSNANGAQPLSPSPRFGDTRRPSALRRPFVFLATWRSLPPYEMASYPLMFASVPMLAAGIRRYDAALVEVILLSVVALYGGFFAALIWNDITDADIDSVAHPDRPIPSGRISTRRFFRIATFFSAVALGFAYWISPWCLAVAIVAALYVTLHNRVLKRTVRIPAYSEIFTPFQWAVVGIFGYVAVWSSVPAVSTLAVRLPGLGSLPTSTTEIWKMALLAVFIYFVDGCHDIPEGIADAAGDRVAGVRTYATSFGEKNAARVALVWFALSGVLGVALFVVTSLSSLFAISFTGLFCYTGVDFLRLSRMTDVADMRAFGSTVGRHGFNYFLFAFDLMFIDLLGQLIAFHATHG